MDPLASFAAALAALALGAPSVRHLPPSERRTAGLLVLAALAAVLIPATWGVALAWLLYAARVSVGSVVRGQIALALTAGILCSGWIDAWRIDEAAFGWATTPPSALVAVAFGLWIGTHLALGGLPRPREPGSRLVPIFLETVTLLAVARAMAGLDGTPGWMGLPPLLDEAQWVAALGTGAAGVSAMVAPRPERGDAFVRTAAVALLAWGPAEAGAWAMLGFGAVRMMGAEWREGTERAGATWAREKR